MRTLFLTAAAAFALAAGVAAVTPTDNAAALLADQYAGRAQSILVANAEGAGVDARSNTQMLALQIYQPADTGTG